MARKLPSLRELLIAGGVRGGIHLGVVALIALSLWLNGNDILAPSLSANEAAATVEPTALPRVVLPAPTKVQVVEQQEPIPPSKPLVVTAVQALLQVPVPSTIIPERPRQGVITYTVEAGDTVLSIAERFGLRRETVVWTNGELDPDPAMLYVGQVLDILPVDGVYHTVSEGETLATIAERYDATVEAIVGCEWNGFAPGETASGGDADPGQPDASTGGTRIEPGQKLIIPDGVKRFRPRFVRFTVGTISRPDSRGQGDLVWPIEGEVAQGYWDLHRGIDIAGEHGDPVVAADAGVVVYASWECSGYGNLVIIDHGNGYVSYYAHLYGFYVDAGQVVKRGQAIGVRGNTGRSTGPHLHFEVRHSGVQIDPLSLLPRE